MLTQILVGVDLLILEMRKCSKRHTFSHVPSLAKELGPLRDIIPDGVEQMVLGNVPL